MSNNDKYYRITYNGEGIYNALKKCIALEKWQELLKSEKINWLPKPPSYAESNKSYFTEKGYDKFKELVLPIVYEHLDNKNIQIEKVENISNVIYEDEFQVVINK